MEATSRLQVGPEPGPMIRGTGEDDPQYVSIRAVPIVVALSLPLWALLGLVARWLLGWGGASQHLSP
jgi:hypothetical protein